MAKSQNWRPTVLSDTCRIGVGQLRAAARHYLQLAAGGDPIMVIRRRKAVAQIHSFQEGELRSSAAVSSEATCTNVVQLAALSYQASHCLDLVATGEVVEVVDGDRPVAHILPYVDGSDDLEGRRLSRRRITGCSAGLGLSRGAASP